MNIQVRHKNWNAIFLTSIDDIPEEDWNSCASISDPYIRHQHLNALEKSGVISSETGFKPQHVAICDDSGSVIAVAPVYLKSHSHGELGVDLGLGMAHERAVGPYYPKLQIEVPFTPITGSRLLVKPGIDRIAACAELCSALKERAKEIGASSIQISYMSDEDKNFMGQFDFLLTEGNAYIWKSGGVKSFDEFLSKMKSSKRSKILSERRKAVANGLTFKTLSGEQINSKLAPVFFDLYKSTFERNETAPWLNVKYFELLFENMKEYLEVTLALQKEALVAVQLDMVTPKIRYAQHWGHTGNIPFLLFEMSIYQTIEHAIVANQKMINSGTTGLHKTERGFGIEPTHHALWFADSNFTDIAKIGLRRKQDAANFERKSEMARQPFRKLDFSQETGK